MDRTRKPIRPDVPLPREQQEQHLAELSPLPREPEEDYSLLSEYQERGYHFTVEINPETDYTMNFDGTINWLYTAYTVHDGMRVYATGNKPMIAAQNVAQLIEDDNGTR